MENFLEEMQDLLDCEQEVTMDTVLEGIDEWDSLAYVGFMALAATSYTKTVKAGDVRGAKTVSDLYNLVK